jgi:carboxypeptidase Taq
MGYDFDSGRQDISAHPFSSHFSPQDARVTTRIDENNLSEMIWSCIHEGGHALYEQGILSENYGTPLGNSVSLGIHESQSRLWENHVGRSLEYWKYNYPSLKSLFPDKLKNVDYYKFYEATNNVKPSLIRTNADELTYHLHVLIRYEIEKGLIEGSIDVKDLPTIWNKKYFDYLGIKVPSDSKGVLQDIHWSHVSFGYFPTYTIGSFYAAQFFYKASAEIDNIETKIGNGDFVELLDWLRKKVHIYGERYDAKVLCERITGEELNFKYFMQYVTKKYSKIYKLD